MGWAVWTGWEGKDYLGGRFLWLVSGFSSSIELYVFSACFIIYKFKLVLFHLDLFYGGRCVIPPFPRWLALLVLDLLFTTCLARLGEAYERLERFMEVLGGRKKGRGVEQLRREEKCRGE